MPKLRRKVITIEVETVATNAEIMRAMASNLPEKGVPLGLKEDGTEVEGTVFQVSVNDVTPPKGGKGKR